MKINKTFKCQIKMPPNNNEEIKLAFFRFQKIPLKQFSRFSPKCLLYIVTVIFLAIFICSVKRTNGQHHLFEWCDKRDKKKEETEKQKQTERNRKIKKE